MARFPGIMRHPQRHQIENARFLLSNMNMSTTNPRPCKDVIFTDFDGNEGILVDLNTKRYYQLNETAMLVWKGLEQGKTVNEIVVDVTACYEVTAEHATRSVQKVVDNFQSYKLVSMK